MATSFFIIGSISGFLAVAFGAFAAHALKSRLDPDLLAIFETGVRYHFYHTLALFLAAWALQKFQYALFGAAAWSFVAGIVIFSGSLYVLSLTGLRWLGVITPFGGLAFLAGWLLLAVGFWKNL